jgi:ribosomal protein S18 acetylase RimI-like enzyme
MAHLGPMILRAPTLDDASSLAAIGIEVWTGTYLKRGVNGFFADFVLNEFTPAKMRALIEDPGQFILLAQDRDGITGFIRFTQNLTPPNTACSSTEIATFYVQPRHHGTGIGSQLLKAGLDHCRKAGAASVWLTTNAENTPAIEFYKARGFTQIGETFFEIEDAQYLNNIYAYTF